MTVQRPSAAVTQILFLHHHCFRSKTWHFPPEPILFCRVLDAACQCLTLSLLTSAESAGARCCMNLRVAVILAFKHVPSHWLAKPSVLRNLVFVSWDSSVLEPAGLWFSHKWQQQCHCPPASGVQLEVQFLFIFSPSCRLRRG